MESAFNQTSMEIIVLHKNLSKTEEVQFDDYLGKKIPALDALLTSYARDAKTLNVSIEKFEKHSAYEVEFCLNLPQKSLVAKETSHAITKCTDLTKDRLVAQIKKHMALLKGGRVHRSIKGEEAEVLSPVDAFIEETV